MKRIGCLAVALLILATWSCSSKEKETLKLGMILSTTGSSAATGTRQVEAATLATEEINAQGGVLGKDLEFEYRDDGSDKARAPGLATELVQMGVPAILGSGSSSITLAIAKVTAPAGVVQISGSSTSPALTAEPDNGYLFRTAPSDALQGKLLARRAWERGQRTVSIIHAPGAYGEGLAATFKSEFIKAGGAVGFSVAYVEHETEPTYLAMLDTVYAPGAPDAILLVATVADGAKIVRAYVSNHHERDTFWYFTDAVSVSDFVTGVGASSFDALRHEGTQPGTPQSSVRFEAFASAYQQRFGKSPEVFAANAYDAVYLLALGLQAAGQPNGPALRDQMTAISSAGKRFGPTEYRDAVAALAAGIDLDYDGASGPVDFNGQGDVVGGYNIWKVAGGAITVAERSVGAE